MSNPKYLPPGPWLMYADSFAALQKMVNDAFPSAPLPSEKPDISKKKKPKSESSEDDEESDDDDDEEDEEASQCFGANSPDEDSAGYTTLPNGIAVIDIVGPMMKDPSFITRYFGGTATSEVVAMLADAAQDPSVRGVMFRINSGGGQSIGPPELANAIREFSQGKPTAAFIDGYGASAAYLVASAAQSVASSPSSLIGSIGTMLTIEDTSKLAENAGVKVHLITSGGVKGAGTPGTPLTEAQLADKQRLVDEINANFVQAVAQGRGMTIDQVYALADGKIHTAGAAQKLGLIDSVGTFANAVDALHTTILKSSKNPMDKIAAFQKENPGVLEAHFDAKLKEHGEAQFKAGQVKGHDEGVASERERVKLLNECPTFAADKNFVLSQIVNGNEVGKAKTEYADVLLTRVQQLEKETRERAEREQTANAAHPGHGHTQPLPVPAANGSHVGDAKHRFSQKVDELMAGPKKMTRAQAVANVVKTDPQLHEAWLEQVNAGR